MWFHRRHPRLRFIRQRDAMQCGVASLAMICGLLGRRVTLAEVERHCHPTAEGVSLKGIGDAATAMGLDNTAVKITLQELVLIGEPAILHWNQNHFVVLRRTSRNGTRFHIADPGKGTYTLSRAEFESRWLAGMSLGEEKGVAMFFEPTPSFFTAPQQACNEAPRGFRFLFGYVARYRRYFALIALGLTLGCAFQLVMPFLTQWIVDIGIGHRNIGFIWLILLGELMIVAGRTATDFIRRWLLLHISLRVNISLVSDFFIKLLRLPMAFFDTKLTGDLMQRMADHTRVQSFLTDQTLGIMFSFLSFVVFGVVLAIYSMPVFGVFIIGSAVYALWIVSFMHRRKVLDYELFEQQAINRNVTWEFITSMQEIKLQGCETRRRWEWEDVQADLFALQMKSLRLQQSRQAGSVFINEVKNIVITVLAATAVINGSITIGGMLAIQYIVGQLNSPVEQLMGLIYSIQDVKISLERINEIHCGTDEESNRSEPQSQSTSGDTPAAPQPQSITLKGVTFKYDLHSPVETLSDISLTIPQGKITAIVGASGSGKTTLLKLLLGYYPALTGEIAVGGTPLATMSLKEWRRRCGAVMQEGVIFSESIARNIANADGPVNTTKLHHAARIACIHDYIMSLPLGYDTRIGNDGTGLSLGQKQRILIARAVYRDPEFILLDEATNSLDADNERAIVGNLARFYGGRTVVVVAHRLSTVRDAHNILVLSKGRIVESGTHAQLIALRGHYYNLIRNQLELGS